MILKQLQKQIEQQKRGEFIYPLYKNYCFSNIPSAILSLFGKHINNPLSKILEKAKINSSNSKKVILLFIDSFGYKQWLKYAERYEFFKKITKRGVVAPLTTVFPSTTAATQNTIHSGLTPQEHGLLEWWVYFEEIDKIISTLPFTPVGEKGRDKLLDDGVDPKILFDGKTIYQILAESKIPSFTFIRDVYAQSAYSKLVHQGSVTIPFINSSDLLVNLRKKIVEIPSAAYFYIYWDAVDSISHTYGPETDQYLAELNGFSYLLQKEFLEKIDKQLAKEIVILITSDHGQVSIDPKETIYLNQYPEITDNFCLGPSGNKILPWGSPRDVFLFIQEEKLQSTFEFLNKILNGKATIMRTEKAIKENLFGHGNPHKKFKSRIGNILILPHNNNTVWYEHIKNERLKLYGMHGGLSDDEMLIPFVVAKLSKLF